MGGAVRVGISGWTYQPWRGTFYPAGLPQARELAYAASRLSSIEINGTFYSLQRPSSYARWHDAVPADFVFAVKAPRYITHILRLKDARAAVANFFASGVLRLGKKLGPILWQLPPRFLYKKELLEDFLALLPRDTEAAARLAGDHDAWLSGGRVWLEPGGRRPLRHAVEVRHESFDNPEFFALLRKAKIALVLADTAGKWPKLDVKTAPFGYARLHGDKELYASGYTPGALRAWAKTFAAWRRAGRDIYVYFDNDAKVRAPVDAMALARLLKRPGR